MSERIDSAEIHKSATVIDGHSDILMAVADRMVRLGETFDVPDPQSWQPPAGLASRFTGDLAEMQLHRAYFGTAGQYSIPQWLAGGVTAQVCAIFLEDSQLDRALRRALEMVYCLHQEVADNDNFELITSCADIERLKQEGKCGAILGLEGLEPLGRDLHLLDIFYELGLRIVGMTHNRRNAFADGFQPHIKTGGLTQLGKQAVKRMNELGIVIDLGHLNQVGFWDVMELSEAPVLLSHTIARDAFPKRAEDSRWHPRRDVSRGHERMRAIAEQGGLIGAIFVTMNDIDEVIDDVEYVMDLVGDDHIGLGSDFYGWSQAPKGMEHIGLLPKLTERMVERGFSAETLHKFLGGNYLRIFNQVWKP